VKDHYFDSNQAAYHTPIFMVLTFIWRSVMSLIISGEYTR
jgi:hypothetical protein